MKPKKSTSPVLLHIVGLALITGLVHASAQETKIEGVYLRPLISPYITTETKVVSLDSSSLSDIALTSDASVSVQGSDDQEAVSLELKFIDYVTQAISSGFDEIARKDNVDLFTRLKLQMYPEVNTGDETNMISNIQVKTNSSSSVTLNWLLNKFADVTIYYDTQEVIEAGVKTPSVKISAFRFAHGATIDGLAADTTYHYLIVVDNHFSKAITMSSGSFRTAP